MINNLLPTKERLILEIYGSLMSKSVSQMIRVSFHYQVIFIRLQFAFRDNLSDFVALIIFIEQLANA